MVYAKNETKWSWPIGLGAICDENQQENNVTDHNGAVYTENDTVLSWLIG